jgi:hypothetical protein
MKFINTFFFITVLGIVYAQYDGQDSLVASRYRPGFMWFNTGWRPAKVDKPRKYDRLIIDFQTTMWHSKPALQTSFIGSLGWNIHTLWDVPLTKGNTISLGWGFSYKHQRIGLSGDLEMDSSTHAMQYVPSTNSTNLASKHVFGTHVVALPLEIRFRLEKWRHVKFHLGGSIGYCFESYEKWWYKAPKIQLRTSNIEDVNPLVYGIHARLGIRNWAIFANYNFSHQFASKQSSMLTPISFGLSVSLF